MKKVIPKILFVSVMLSSAAWAQSVVYQCPTALVAASLETNLSLASTQMNGVPVTEHNLPAVLSSGQTFTLTRFNTPDAGNFQCVYGNNNTQEYFMLFALPTVTKPLGSAWIQGFGANYICNQASTACQVGA